MTRHIEMDCLAKWVRGQVDEKQRQAVEGHWADCPKCREMKARVKSAVNAMTELGRTEPPINWERMDVRMNWAISSELRLGQRLPAKSRAHAWYPWALGCALALGGFVVWSRLAALRPSPSRPVVASQKDDGASVMTASSVPKPRPLEGVVTLLEGESLWGDSPVTSETRVVAGLELVTHAGRLGVQFGERCAFLMDPESTLELMAFDERTVEMRVVGGVTVWVEKRAPEERFAVWAGSRRVEVRGTILKVVNQEAMFDVAVTRGRVAVIEGSDQVEVPAGGRLRLAAGARVGSFISKSLIDESVESLAKATYVPMLPDWTGATEIRARSALLSVAGGKKAPIRLDDKDVGTGALVIRTIPGRHFIEMGRGSRWMETKAGRVTVLEVLADSVRSERPRQVNAQLQAHSDAFSSCGERVRKHDPEFDGEMEVELGINADGSLDFVTAVKGIADRGAEDCVLNVIRDQFTFSYGTKGTVSKKIRF